MKNSRYAEKGNVLFLILIAVALFAALSFAVTGSSRNSLGGSESEGAKTQFSVLLQYVSSIQAEVLRMQIAESITNPLPPYSDVCRDGDPSYDSTQCLFDTLPFYNSATIETIAGINNGGFAPSSAQIPLDGAIRMLVYLQIFDVSQNVCQELNQFVQVSSIPVMTDQHSYDDLPYDLRTQPLLCVQVASNAPNDYSILLKAYEAEYV